MRQGAYCRIFALIRKECQQIKRDTSTLLIAIVLPLLLLFIYGYGISLDVTQMDIGCVMEDRSSAAQSFIQSLSRSRFFSLHFSDSEQAMARGISSGDIVGGVIIPAYFSDFIKNPEQRAPIFVIADGSQPNTASFVQNYIQGAFNNWIQQEKTSYDSLHQSMVQVVSRVWYNEELDSHYFLIPGSIAIIMTLIGTILTALVIAREWERGTMEALMATPLSIFEIFIGKLIPYFFLGLISLFVCTAIGCFLFGVPLRGSFLTLGIVSSVFLLSSLGLGLFISSATKNQFNASQIAIVTAFLPAFMLSGFIFEISSMPLRIQVITYLLPARYMVSSLQTIFLVGDVFSLLLYNCLAMGLFACVLFVIMSLKAKKRLD